MICRSNFTRNQNIGLAFEHCEHKSSLCHSMCGEFFFFSDGYNLRVAAMVLLLLLLLRGQPAFIVDIFELIAIFGSRIIECAIFIVFIFISPKPSAHLPSPPYTRDTCTLHTDERYERRDPHTKQHTYCQWRPTIWYTILVFFFPYFCSKHQHI